MATKSQNNAGRASCPQVFEEAYEGHEGFPLLTSSPRDPGEETGGGYFVLFVSTTRLRTDASSGAFGRVRPLANPSFGGTFVVRRHLYSVAPLERSLRCTIPVIDGSRFACKTAQNSNPRCVCFPWAFKEQVRCRFRGIIESC